MIFKPSSETWDQIHNISYPSIPDCWEKCGGGFCCNNRHELVKFRAIPSGRQSFPVLDSEYHYLKESGALAPEMSANIRTTSAVLKNGTTASVHMMTCSQGGHCFSWEKRPLICKIYPFVPIPDLNGDVTHFEVGSVFDIMFHLAGLPSPCVPQENHAAQLQAGLKEKMGWIFKMPYFIFYFRAFEIIAQELRAGFSEQYKGSPAQDYTRFFRDFEILYMSQKLFSGERIKNKLEDLYSSLIEKYGDFEI
jgi:hypothetical protein